MCVMHKALGLSEEKVFNNNFDLCTYDGRKISITENIRSLS